MVVYGSIKLRTYVLISLDQVHILLNQHSSPAAPPPSVAIILSNIDSGVRACIGMYEAIYPSVKILITSSLLTYAVIIDGCTG